ncbi:MAG: toll/interleukin-1 receptor domain-containing protein [Clostridiales bacterium]|nr:toll/interleukin-1 receptor domain-containing protein [Clostridiales bacterium]
MTDFKYDAFISYRHAEKDTLIASEIQKSLERFKIPKALRKKSGKERFNRVFRDVEELPITSNLTEDLEEALRASEYLIVICSFRTSESTWVKREIEKFLEFHDYNKQRILTVLVEGEPDEVIPEILRHDNITHYLADGTFYCKDEVVEPLAADYRMPLAKARKIELPRLASSMLGCKYDEIIRRRKAYKRTRLLIETALVCAAAIALMIYVGWTFMKIQDALDKAQMNQAIYLSSESQKLLEEGDRIGAIQLALAAFEDGSGNMRPITSEAQYALSSALGAYTTTGNSYSVPVWRYETNVAIKKFAGTDSGDYVMILDNDGIMHVWDKKNNKETLIKDDDYPFLDFILDKNGNLIVFNRNYIALYDLGTNAQKWKYEYTGLVSIVSTSKLFYYEKSGYVAVNLNTSLLVINAEDGKLVKKIETYQKAPFNEKTDNKDAIFSINSYLINDDFSKVAVIGTFVKLTGSYIFVLDVEKDKWTCVGEGLENFLNATFDDDDSITVLRRSEAERNIPANYMYDTSVVLEQINVYGRTIWKTELPNRTRIAYTNIYCSDYTTADGKTTTALYTVFANRAVIVEKSTGKAINSFDLQDGISWSNLGKNNLEIIIRNGKVIWIPRNAGTKMIETSKYFMDGTNDVYLFGNKKSFLVEDSSQRVITEYSSNFSDSKFIAFENCEDVGVVDTSIRCGNYLLTYSKADKTLSGTDLKNHKTLWTSKAPDYTIKIFNNGQSPDNLFVICLKIIEKSATESVYSLIKINCANGQIADANSDFTFTNMGTLRAVNGRVWTKVFDSKAKTVTLYCYNMMDDTVRKTVVDVNELGSARDMLRMAPSPDGKTALIYMDASSSGQEKCYRLTVDCTSGKYTKAECGKCRYAIWNEKGTLFAELYNEGSIKVFSAKGEEKFTKENDQREPWEMQFNEDQLYVVYGNDDLTSFDSRGNQVININLKHGDLTNNDFVELQFANGYLFLTAGPYTDIIKLNDKKSISAFKGFLCVYGADPKDPTLSDAIVVCKTSDKSNSAAIGFFKFKTPSRLIEQAKEYLNQHGAKLTNDFKQKYGLQ